MTKKQKQLKLFLDKNFKKVKYYVSKNEAFGLRSAGDIIDGYLIFEGESGSLLYFPANQNPGECGSICICQKIIDIRKYTYYIFNNDSYINCPNISTLMKLKF